MYLRFIFRCALVASSLISLIADDIYILRESQEAREHSYRSESLGAILNVRHLAVSPVGSRVLALDADGRVYEWRRQPADGRKGEWLPVAVPNGVKKIGAGATHTMLLLENGTVWTAGENTFGQLGDGTLATRTEFRPAGAPTEFLDIAAGSFYSLALDRAGNVWAWGYNWDGIVPGQQRRSVLTPEKIEGLPAGDRLATKMDQPFLSAAGAVWSWSRVDLRSAAQRNQSAPWALSEEHVGMREEFASGDRHYWPTRTNTNRTVRAGRAATGWALAYA